MIRPLSLDGAGPLRPAVNISLLLSEFEFLERPQRAAEAGFDAIECWWPFRYPVPSDRDVDRFVSAIADAGVQLAGLNFYAGDQPAGDRGVASSVRRSREFLDNIDVVMGIGRVLGVPMFNALYGNSEPGQTRRSQQQVAVENLVVAARSAAAIDATVLIEPLSAAPQYPLRSAEDALEVIAEVRDAGGVENVALLADVYHLAVNGSDVAAVIETHAHEFGHLQIADAPGRGAPGTGELPIDAWLQLAVDGGYRGFVGLEYAHPAESAFAWLAPTVRGRAAKIDS